ncbi:SfnB family sulfur acquisition oxidoreductase [Hoyosella rhizosphaerae]|uniref:Dibenzothiophene monooxygenase n=1 Tax=Hoyosella rhizosphaerae TaxID=1755582 RepID=A0A916X9A3_9ACTN|nr:SfnB family sulfur acquisition oxidoreductase [Hoyosella rhizosphaerae]MBN4927236.1 SfnB family sulfur acquisition oxidoreductase [Hoyosella rhizosphaerae]GGC52886.1 SfnB family sulfur acquisition oxidoreductase [Hoyosella rhizosphaerae]
MTWDATIQTVHKLADEFRQSAPQRDRDRSLPFNEITELSTAGFFALTIPREYGGLQAPPSVVAEATRILATADPNIAQIPQSHFVYVNFLKIAGSHQQKQYFFSKILDGQRLANAQSERNGSTIASITTTLDAVETGYRLNGTKYYCTGTVFADWIPVLSTSEGTEFVAFVPSDSPGLTIDDDWNGFGQRTTASGTVHLDNVHVDSAWVVPREPAVRAPAAYGAFAQLLHAAIDAGIARNALDDAAEFIRTSARPWFEAKVDEARDDPLTTYRLGEVTVDVASAEALVAEAGALVDEAFAAFSSEQATRASLAVAIAKAAADRAALSATNALHELGGTRTADASLNLHRHWRNARTHTLHDPVRWKYHNIGRALLGHPQPQHALF